MFRFVFVSRVYFLDSDVGPLNWFKWLRPSVEFKLSETYNFLENVFCEWLHPHNHSFKLCFFIGLASHVLLWQKIWKTPSVFDFWKLWCYQRLCKVWTSFEAEIYGNTTLCAQFRSQNCGITRLFTQFRSQTCDISTFFFTCLTQIETKIVLCLHCVFNQKDDVGFRPFCRTAFQEKHIFLRHATARKGFHSLSKFRETSWLLNMNTCMESPVLTWSPPGCQTESLGNGPGANVAAGEA